MSNASEGSSDTALPKGVLFADICDSSRVLRELGDEIARGLIEKVLAKLSEVAERRGGRVVSHIGDEVLCVFPDARAMATAAVEMHRDLRELNASGGLESPITIRIGLHFGKVLERDGELFGETVYSANRMVSLAKGQQILTTSETLDHLGRPSPFASRFVDFTTIRGKRGKFEVHELIWDAEGVTWAPALPATELLDAEALEICHGDRKIELDGDFPVLTIGRGVDRDLIIDEPPVSRHHARIEQRKGGFAYVDHSTNGSFVLLNGREWVQVHRDERRLEGSGIIVLGPEKNGAAVLHYRTLDLDATLPTG